LRFEVDTDGLIVLLAAESVGVGVAGVAGDDESTQRVCFAVVGGGVWVFGRADAALKNGIAALLGGGNAHDHGGDGRIGEQVAEEALNQQ